MVWWDNHAFLFAFHGLNGKKHVSLDETGKIAAYWNNMMIHCNLWQKKSIHDHHHHHQQRIQQSLVEPSLALEMALPGLDIFLFFISNYKRFLLDMMRCFESLLLWLDPFGPKRRHAQSIVSFSRCVASGKDGQIKGRCGQWRCKMMIFDRTGWYSVVVSWMFVLCFQGHFIYNNIIRRNGFCFRNWCCFPRPVRI